MLIILLSKNAKKRTSSSSSSWNTKPSSDSGFFTRCSSWFVPKHYGNRNSIKSKSISLWIKGLVYYKKENAPARQDKPICMRAMLLGNCRSRVELLGGQLCCFFWTATSLIWWESNLNEWIEEIEKIKRNVSGRRRRKGEEGRKTTQNFRHLEDQRKKMPPKTEQLTQSSSNSMWGMCDHSNTRETLVNEVS